MVQKIACYALCSALAFTLVPQALAAPGDGEVYTVIQIGDDGTTRKVGLPTKNQLLLGMGGLLGSIGGTAGVWKIETSSGNEISIVAAGGCAAISKGVADYLGYFQQNRVNLRAPGAQRVNSVDFAVAAASNIGIPALVGGICIHTFGSPRDAINYVANQSGLHKNPRKLLENDWWYDHAVNVAREGAEDYVRAVMASEQALRQYLACRSFHSAIYCSPKWFAAQSAGRRVTTTKAAAKALIDATDEPVRTHALDLGLPHKPGVAPVNETVLIPRNIVLP